MNIKNNNIYNLIYRLKPKEIGAGLFAIKLEQTFPKLFKSYNYIDGLPETNRIWALENPYFYNCTLTDRLKDYWFLRKDIAKFFPVKRLTCGYSYYKSAPELYQSYIPTIFQSNFSKNDKPSIGYYIRDIRNESNYAFIDLINSLPNDLPIITMGTKEILYNELYKRKNWQHTYDANYFFKNCSHYFYYQCSDFEDPLPHSLLEAIQSQHRIISPKNPKRNHKDGIDDLLSFIEYDETFLENKEGKFCDGLQAKHWEQYIESVINSNFSKPSILYNKSMYDWACKIL